MSSPGSICIVANQTDWRHVTPDGCRVVLTLDSLAVAVPPPDRFAGVYASADLNNVVVVKEVKEAAARGVRVYCFWDDWWTYPDDVLHQLPASAVPLLPLYQAPRRLPSESLAEAIVRWNRNAAHLNARWPWYWGVVPQTYLGGTTLDRVLAGQVPSVDLVNAYDRAKVAVCFAWNRENGGHIAVLAQCQENVCAASPGDATLLPVDTGGLPKATSYGGRMNVSLKYKGKYIGVNPAFPDVVYADRDKSDAWEAITLTQLPSKLFSAWFEAAQRFLTIDDLGNLGTRTAVNAWESHCAINPPDEYKTTPSQLYQPTHGVILEIEAR